MIDRLEKDGEMEISNAAFTKKITLKLCDALETQGFTRFRKEWVDWPIHDGFHCWVGLVVSHERDRVYVIPNVGVHVVPLERLVCKIDGNPKRKYNRIIASYALPLSFFADLTNEQWVTITHSITESAIDYQCEKLAKIYATNGLEYARSIASYETLARLIEPIVDTLGGKPERYAGCLYLNNRKQDARDFLLNFPAKDRPYIEEFADRIIRLIDEELG